MQKLVSFDIGIRREIGEVVRENKETVWVRLGDKLVKRHKTKHRVKPENPQNPQN